MRSPPSAESGDRNLQRLSANPSETQLLEPPPNRARTADVFTGLPPTWGFSLSAGSERVVRAVLLRGDLGGLRLAFDGASDGFLHGAIVEVLDLLVVLGFPMDEHADADEQIVSLVGGDHAFGDGIGDRLGHGVLRGAEHLHGLACVLDGHLVVEDRWGLAEKVRRDHREQRGEAILVVGQCIAERLFDGAATRTNEQIDMSNFVAVADERLANTRTTYLGHETPSLMG